MDAIKLLEKSLLSYGPYWTDKWFVVKTKEIGNVKLSHDIRYSPFHNSTLEQNTITIYTITPKGYTIDKNSETEKYSEVIKTGSHTSKEVKLYEKKFNNADLKRLLDNLFQKTYNTQELFKVEGDYPTNKIAWTIYGWDGNRQEIDVRPNLIMKVGEQWYVHTENFAYLNHGSYNHKLLTTDYRGTVKKMKFI